VGKKVKVECDIEAKLAASQKLWRALAPQAPIHIHMKANADQGDRYCGAIDNEFLLKTRFQVV
jgi:hypothetical protein